jgi:hypothetical protein
VLLLCTLIGFRFAWRTLLAAGRHLVRILADAQTESLGWKLITILAPVLLFLSLFRAFALPSWDGTTLYLSFPKIVAATQRLVPLPGYEYFVATLGSQGEMHFAALMALSDDTSARLFTWPTSLAAALLLISTGQYLGLRRRGQWLALAAVYTTSTFSNLTGDGKTDIFAAAMGLAAFYTILKSQGGAEATALRLGGLFTGFAVIAKNTYAASLLPGILLLFAWQALSDRTPLKRLIRRSFQLGLWMALPTIPFFLKNLALFGQIIPGAILHYASQGTWLPQEAVQRTILTFPFALALKVPDPNLYGNLSPLPLAFAPLALLLARPRNVARSRLFQLNVCALVGIVLWLIFGTSVLGIRYMFAPLLILYLLPLLGAERATTIGTRPLSLNACVLICTIVLAVTRAQYFTGDVKAFVAYAAGHVLDCTDDQDGRSCVLLHLNDDAAQGSRIYAHSSPRFWLRPDLLQCLSTSDEEHAVHVLPDAGQRWRYLYDHGFRYLLIDHLYYNTTFPAENDNPFDLGRLPPGLKLVTLYDKPGLVTAYRLEWETPSPPPSLACQAVTPRWWRVLPNSQHQDAAQTQPAFAASSLRQDPTDPRKTIGDRIQ